MVSLTNPDTTISIKLEDSIRRLILMINIENSANLKYSRFNNKMWVLGWAGMGDEQIVGSKSHLNPLKKCPKIFWLYFWKIDLPESRFIIERPMYSPFQQYLIRFNRYFWAKILWIRLGHRSNLTKFNNFNADHDQSSLSLTINGVIKEYRMQ